MDFKLDIGELTNTINDYENTIKILAEQKGNINKTAKELTDQGWSGAAKDQFEQNHAKKQEFYANLIEQIKYTKNALENEEKPRAIQLKKRCEDFESCIKRSAGGVALTNDDIGIISLEYGGQFPINNNVDECVNNHFKKMDSKFLEIQNLLNSLTFTSFSIGEDIEKARRSLKDQTTSLTDFKDSFNAYCNGVRDMEENICSAFSKISGITGGICQIRGMSIISESGQVNKNKVMQLMLKNPNSLTNEEKELLSYMEKVLGKGEYAKLKEQVIKEDNGQEIADNLKFKFGDTSIYNKPFSGLADDVSFIWGKADGCCKWLTGGLDIIDTLNAISMGRIGSIAETGELAINEAERIPSQVEGISVFLGNIGTKFGKVKFISRDVEYTVENMKQYIRSVLYGQHQFALPNGMGTINATEDLFKFSKIKANPEKVINSLSNYESRKWIFDNKEFMLDKSGMKHILKRHHPEYWEGSVKSTQTFLDKNMSVDDITNTVSEVLKQNREKLIEKGTTGMYQVEGTVDGVDYVVGLNKGRVGQFYKK